MLFDRKYIKRTYDANYRLTDLTSPALTLHYQRDAAGNVTGITDSSTNNAFTYDASGRLITIKDNQDTVLESYTYNKTGDRLSKTASGLATGTYGYQANTHWVTSIGDSARRYDKAGNTTGNSAAGETWGYGYDGKNRMTVVQREGSTVATYAYNAFGERVAKAVTLPQTVNERFVYNENSQLIAERGSTNKDYIWLDALPVAVVDNEASISTINYVTADGLNTPRAVSNTNGATIWTWSIVGNPFGEQPPTSSTGYVYNLRFPGQYFDVESGLNYNVQRYYDAPKGGYTQVDLIGFAGGQASLYAYTDSNPLDNIDPLGNAPEPPVFQLPPEKPIFRTPWYKPLLKKADDILSEQIVKKMTKGALTISDTGELIASRGSFFITLLYSPPLGGCVDGHCADETYPGMWMPKPCGN
jgi:RHS repeat-associated protein